MKKIESFFNEVLSGEDMEHDEDWVIRLGFLVHDAARLRRIAIDDKFKPLEITRSQAWLMAYVSRGDGQTQSDLAAQMSLGKVAIGGLIDRLEKTEMIERRAEATDRRVKRIHLTDKGSKVIRSMRKLTMEANKEILAGISMKKIKQAAAVLARIKKNTESMME
jgi:MarR family transcriptional regulator, transcriptional regulator for hemolysin